MKIDNRVVNYEISKNLPKSASNIAEGKHLSNEQKVKDNPESQDTIVNFSRASKEVQLAEKVISAEPDVREDKVSVLRARIESGKYKIDHEEVADKLVDNALDEILSS